METIYIYPIDNNLEQWRIKTDYSPEFKAGMRQIPSEDRYWDATNQWWVFSDSWLEHVEQKVVEVWPATNIVVVEECPED